MINKVKIYKNAEFVGHIYQKQDGTYTSWSSNDIIAAYLVAILIGASLLALIA